MENQIDESEVINTASTAEKEKEEKLVIAVDFHRTSVKKEILSKLLNPNPSFL